MYVDVAKIDRKQHLIVAGDEPWLAAVYAGFQVPKEQVPPRISGWIDVEPLKLGFAEVCGELTFSPYVACSRCGDPIQWPIKTNFAMSYRNDQTQSMQRKEVDLERDELDHYFLKDNRLDVEELINEQIQIAIPSRTVKSGADGGCSVCHLPLEEDQVYSEQPDAGKSPFSVLSSLKN